MDILINTEKRPPYFLIAGSVTVLIIAIVWLILQPSAQQRITLDDLWSGEVQQGDLQLQVSGYGRLKSRSPRLLTAHSNATVEEVLLKPGALVEPESVILRLSDPQVSQALYAAEQALTQRTNQYRQLEINQQRELLAQQAELEILRSALESAQLQVNTQNQLIAKGIVSYIDYQRSVLELRQLTRRLDIEQQRITQLRQLHLANLAIAQSNIDAQTTALTHAKHRFDTLTVTAGITGVVQSLAVELGHWTFAEPSLAAKWQLRHSQLSMQGLQYQLVVLTNIEQVVYQTEQTAWHKMTKVLSHEINNSLAPIKSLAQSLEQMLAEHEPDVLDALSVIGARSDGLMKFVNRYANLATEYDVRLTPINVEECAESVMGLFDYPIAKDIKMAWVLADKVLLEQVLVNLVKNAIEASKDRARILINAKQQGEQVVISVVDSGSGIANPDNLFVPFYTTKTQGKGIGLTLCRNMVEQ